MRGKYKHKKQRRFKRFIEKHRDPVLFVEEFYGVKLLPYQKMLLKTMSKVNNLNLFKRRGY